MPVQCRKLTRIVLKYIILPNAQININGINQNAHIRTNGYKILMKKKILSLRLQYYESTLKSDSN